MDDFIKYIEIIGFIKSKNKPNLYINENKKYTIDILLYKKDIINFWYWGEETDLCEDGGEDISINKCKKEFNKIFKIELRKSKIENLLNGK